MRGGEDIRSSMPRKLLSKSRQRSSPTFKAFSLAERASRAGETWQSFDSRLNTNQGRWPIMKTRNAIGLRLALFAGAFFVLAAFLFLSLQAPPSERPTPGAALSVTCPICNVPSARYSSLHDHSGSLVGPQAPSALLTALRRPPPPRSSLGYNRRPGKSS